jgi:uncharacterized membrane protein YjgN (DUF898 family)
MNDIDATAEPSDDAYVPADKPAGEAPEIDSAGEATSDAPPVRRLPYQFSFEGEGGELFGVYLVGLVLSIVTLSVYYPWFRAATLRYLYEKTEFMGSRFSFIGSGQEMFVGYIKFLIIIGVVFGSYYGGILVTQSGDFSLGGVLTMIGGLGFIVLRPLAVHGALRFRLSRTVWRGIHAGYVGKLGELFGLVIGGGLLTGITFGVYYPTFMTNLYGYVIRNLRFGSLRAKFTGTVEQFWGFFRPLYVAPFIGIPFLVISVALASGAGPGAALAGFIIFCVFAALIIGMFVFYFRFQSGLYNWLVERTQVVNEADGKSYELVADFNPGSVFQLQLVNTLLLGITLGLAFPWIIARNLSFFFENVSVDGSFEPDSIQQTQAPEADATGEGLLDFFDIGIA